ncbi:hypothetical protein K8R78_06310 [bacterium]|nr:hypothetical protein [bacterium]
MSEDNNGLPFRWKLLIGFLAIIGLFSLFSSIFWSIWMLKWILGPVIVVGLIFYLIGRSKARR